MRENSPVTPTLDKSHLIEVSELPELLPDHNRVVHICHPENLAYIFEVGGLDYSRYGMAMSTARAYSTARDVKYGSDDPRFSDSSQICVVYDIPFSEWKMHNRIGKASGLIPNSCLVGVVRANQKPKLQILH